MNQNTLCELFVLIYIDSCPKNGAYHTIYANPEHIHFLISRSPNISEEYIASIVADSSSKFINENKLVQGHFNWQESASAFSVSKRDMDKVCKYILNQKVTFNEEYDQFIKFYEKTIQSLK